MLELLSKYFHLYGFLIGVAVWVSLMISEKKVKEFLFPEDFFWRASTICGIGAIVGARLYHVITDFSFYQNSFIDILKVWQGGLSIIGAVLGGLIALFLYYFWNKKLDQYTDKKIFPHNWPLQYLDIMAFGLPFGQAIGRLGNFFNQELYGLPTNLPWKIYIDEDHRFLPYLNQKYYHPLFAYEMIIDIFIGLSLHYLAKKKIWKIGSVNYFLLYEISYSFFRFLLDFLRIDKSYLFHFVNGYSIGKNQFFLLCVVIASGLMIITRSFFTRLKNER
jgi:phosphatidylglycerol:prolipoprotein diacylglycerol transferase